MPRETETPNWCPGGLHHYLPSFPDFLIVNVLKSPASTGVHSHCFMGPDRHQAFAHWCASSTATTVFPPLLSPPGKQRHVSGPEATEASSDSQEAGGPRAAFWGSIGMAQTYILCPLREGRNSRLPWGKILGALMNLDTNKKEQIPAHSSVPVIRP